MSRRRAVVTSSGARTSPEEIRDEKEEEERDREGTSPALVVGRSGFLWLALLVLLLNGSWAVYHFQYESLPSPLNAAQAGKRGFSEALAMEHVKYLTSLGPHPVGSSALDVAVQYVFAAAEKIKKTAHWEVDVQVDLYHSRTGVNSLRGGFFKGKTLIYSDLKHVVLKILPKYHAEAEEKIILVSSHIDTVFSTEGAGDCSSCIAVMLELARGVSQWAHGFKQGVIFLFNTGEEEGLNGAHSFITQHPWASHVKLAIDLEAMGIGGKSTIFQVGASRWPIETYAKVSKYPSGQVIAQDLFLSGAIQSATDFQVYQELVGLPGLDFAYTDATAVYHTKNDKLKLLKPGSLQHLGENMLAFLIHSSMSSNFSKELEIKREENSHQNQHIFFDILGMYMVVYPQHLASTFHNSVILQSLLLWTVSLFMGGYRGSVSFGLSFLSIVLTWAFSLSFSIVVALIISLISATPVPYVAHPWLIIGLFGAPALLGALSGQHLGFSFIVKYLRHSFSLGVPRLPPNIQEKIIKLEAERWIFKAGFIQWMILLIVGNYYKAGCSYMALVWLVSPAFAYGLMEATLSPIRAPKQLKVATLILGLIAPIVFSAGIIIRLVATVIGIIVRSERNPGSIPEWFANVVVAVIVSTVVCLMLVYLLSYYHLSGAKGLVIISLSVLLVLSLAAVSTGIIRPYTEEISRTINVVHVVETKGNYDENQEPRSFISLFSSTPGKLLEEVKDLKDEDFTCGETWSVDFVSFTVKFGCWSFKDVESGWHKSDIPVVHVESDSVSSDVRTTRLFIDTRISKRWSLAINKEEIRDFTFEVDSEELIQLGDKSNVDGWHTIQFSGGMNAPTKFHMNLIWTRNETFHYQEAAQKEGSPPLLKLRTDVNRNTPKVQRILDKLPPWCSLFGKMTSPYTLAFLTTLPVDI